MGCCPEDDLGRFSAARWPQGVGLGCIMFSFVLSVGSDMDGATNDERSPNAALLRLDVGAFPVCWVYSAFFLAMAAAASGNIAVIVDGSNPEFLLLPGDGKGRPRECREPSFPIASLIRFDILSELSLAALGSPGQGHGSPWSPIFVGESMPGMGCFRSISSNV